VTVIDVDLFQPDSWADGVPHAVFDKLRAEDPVLLTRLPGIEVSGPVQRMRSSFINGVKHLPVRVC
jgi:hypothetical protein